jgi:hypothetical protein
VLAEFGVDLTVRLSERGRKREFFVNGGQQKGKRAGTAGIMRSGSDCRPKSVMVVHI